MAWDVTTQTLTFFKAGVVVRTFAEFADLLLHPARRIHARMQLKRGRPTSILFVCHGNLCRSPYAAALLRRLTEEADHEFDVASAGFQTEIPTPPRLAIEAAAARGIDLSQHVSQSVSRNLVRERDLVVVMEPRQRVRLLRTFRPPIPPILVLADLDPNRGASRTISDPVTQPREHFDQVYARIDRCVTALADAIVTREAAPMLVSVPGVRSSRA